MLDIHKGYLETLGRYQNKPLEKGFLDPNDELPGKDTVLYLLGTPQDTTGTIYDWSGKDNHGMIDGATQAILPSGLPYLSYVTNDWVDITKNTSLALTTSFTIIVWANVVNDANTKFLLSDDAGVGGNRGSYFGFLADEKLRLFHSDDGTSGYFDDTNAALTVGAFQMLTATTVLDGATVGTNSIKLYSNDALLASTTDVVGDYNKDLGVATRYNPTTNWNLGRRPVPDGYFNGSARGHRFIMGILTLAEITRIFNQERHLFGV